MKLRAGRWLSATQVARACAVDHKTIRNWVGKGKLPCERTTGGHLRFWPLDIAAFLRAYELGVPEALKHLHLRVVVLDEDEERLAAVRKALGRRHEVTTAEHVVDALVAVATLRADVLVVSYGSRGAAPSPLDAGALRARLGALEATRHVRVVDHPGGDPVTMREALDQLVTG